MTKIKGVLHLFSETGTEGGWWAIQDERHIRKDPNNPTGESWSYDGLNVLHDGDKLTVYDKEDQAKVLWKGIIDMKMLPLFTEEAGGLWIHTDQNGIDRATWSKWFFDGNPALLEKS
jgi:hypothetical protein